MPGNEEFVRSIEKATQQIVQETVRNMDRACLLIESDAKKECPVDLGILRASMFSRSVFTATVITGTIANSSEYAPYVHQGTGLYAEDGNGRKTPWAYEVRAGKYKGIHFTRGQHAQPFLQKARDKNKERVLKLLGGG